MRERVDQCPGDCRGTVPVLDNWGFVLPQPQQLQVDATGSWRSRMLQQRRGMHFGDADNSFSAGSEPSGRPKP